VSAPSSSNRRTTLMSPPAIAIDRTGSSKSALLSTSAPISINQRMNSTSSMAKLPWAQQTKHVQIRDDTYQSIEALKQIG